MSVKTNIQLNDELVREGFRLTGFKTKKDLVNYALSELVRRKNQKKILKLRGKIQWEGDLS
ncbi:MAG: type II toxin-antitoxin system VapB family antitoxin, partial [Verrucomicrobiota bacterium]